MEARYNFGVCAGGGVILAVVAELFKTGCQRTGRLLGARGVGNDIGGFCGGEPDF